jgi:hypothetical protein
MPKTKVPKPSSTSTEDEKIAYYRQVATDAVRRDFMWYFAFFGFCLTIAGFFGGKWVLDQAVAKAQLNITATTRERLAQQAIDDTKDCIKKKVQAKMDEVLKDADGRYVKAGKPYALKLKGDNPFILGMPDTKGYSPGVKPQLNDKSSLESRWSLVVDPDSKK